MNEEVVQQVHEQGRCDGRDHSQRESDHDDDDDPASRSGSELISR
jgi:hypothetical protein